jgi:hypothetical protein
MHCWNRKNIKKQMGSQDKQWKEHSDKETAIWTDMLEQAKHNIETTTNQTIKMYESMNDCLRQENELKAPSKTTKHHAAADSHATGTTKPHLPTY